MRKLNFIFLMCMPFVFQSCQGQNFDLEKLVLPTKSEELKTLKLQSSGAGVGTREVQYTSFNPEIEGNIGFGDTKTPPSEGSSQPLLRFYSKDEGKNFQGYTLNLFTPATFEKVLAYVQKSKDKFKLVFDDGKDSEERARAFVSTKSGITFLLLSIADGEGKKHGYIEAISKGEEALLSSRTGGSFGYYGEFLEYKKNKPASFGYLDFLRETNNDLYKQSNNLK